MTRSVIPIDPKNARRTNLYFKRKQILFVEYICSDVKLYFLVIMLEITYAVVP